MRIRPSPGGGWQAVVGSGLTALHRNGFTLRSEAEAWGTTMEQAVRTSTFRIGRTSVLATPAEALRRWAIDQGTLPRAEGGTQVAPLVQFAALLEEPACTLPLAALTPDDLVGLRLRRHAALASSLTTASGAVAMAEQAALAAAISVLCDFYAIRCFNPFAIAAPDGYHLFDKAACARIGALARQVSPGFGLAIDILLATAARPEELEACCLGDFDAERQCLVLPGRMTALPASLARRLPTTGRPGDRLLPELRQHGFQAWVSAQRMAVTPHGPSQPIGNALRLSALVGRLQAGCHPDEALALAGGTVAPASKVPCIAWSD